MTGAPSNKDFFLAVHQCAARINEIGLKTSERFAGNLLAERQKIQPASGASTYNLDRAYTYDTRMRLTGVSATLNGGTTASQTVTYDALQRPASVSRGNSAAETTTFSYTLQGWPNTTMSTSWEEVLFYASPAHTATSGTPVLESAAWEGGRLINGSGTGNVLYYVTDHLGSVRVVKDGSGTIRQRFDYYPYGSVSRVYTNSSTTDNSIKRHRFGGKEIAGTALTDLAGTGAAPGAPYLDFGARLYSPGTATWLSVDPMAEKYYGIGPLTYCAGNPVNLVDENGKAAHIAAGAVIGAAINGGIALYQGKRGREFWGSVAGGAVFGAITAATVGASLAATGGYAVLQGTLGGALGGVAGSITEQTISSGSVDAGQTLAGGVSGALAGATSSLVGGMINRFSSEAMQSIDQKYASQSVQNTIRNEVKAEFRNRGQVLGTTTKQELKAAVAERVETLAETDKMVIKAVSKITDETQELTIGWGMDKLTEWLYEKK